MTGRMSFASCIWIRAQPIWPAQVHKDHIAVIEKREDAPVRIADTDGLITDVPGVLLTTVHADCLPVYLCDPVKRQSVWYMRVGGEQAARNCS